MIVDRQISLIRMIKQIWLRLIWIAVFAVLAVAPLIYFELTNYAIHRSIPLIVGTAIAIFLGFRTNSAYERWCEARLLWGGIVNDSLNLGRLARDLVVSPNAKPNENQDSIVREICYRQIAFVHTLDRQLKSLPLNGVNTNFLSEKEVNSLSSVGDPSLQLLMNQGESIRSAFSNGLIDSYQNNLLQETLSRLTDHSGACKRIKTTPFPVHYSYFTKAFIWIFLLLLGFSLPSYEGFDAASHQSASYIAIPAIFLIGWVFFTVDGIGDYMQSPFEDNRNVVPMQTLSRQVEIGLKTMLGESDIPNPLQPVDGVLS